MEEIIVNLGNDIVVRQRQSDGEVVFNYANDILVKARAGQEVSVSLTQQGPQGPQGEPGTTGDVTPAAQVARDQAVAAAIEARTAADELEELASDVHADAVASAIARDAAGVSATNAGVSAANAADAVVEAEAHSQASQTAASASVTAKEAAQTAQVGSETARGDAQAARDLAEAARAQSVQARADAQLARDEAQAAAVDTDEAVSVALGCRDAAEAFAAAAAQSAAEAGTFDPSSYPTKGNNGSDFADPAQVRINIGAAEAFADIDQAEAEAGIGTIARNWNALRVRQAVAAYAAALDHSHGIADIAGLQTSLNSKASLASPAFTGAPTAPTAAPGTANLQIANTEFVKNAFDAFIGSAPGTLDTIYEIAEALGNDPNAFTTLTNQIAGKANLEHGHVVSDISGLEAALGAKAPLASPAFTGNPTAVTQAANDNSTRLATTAHVKAAIAASGLATDEHTHEIADIDGLQAALNGKAATSHVHVMADISDLAAALLLLAPKASPALTGTPTAPTQAAGNNTTRIATTAFVTTAVANGVSGKANTNHTHVAADITDLQSLLDQKAAIDHGHAISAITGLSDALATKADAETVTTQLNARYTKNEIDTTLGGYYTKSEVDTALSGKSSTGHGHGIADIADLQEALDGKAPVNHGHAIADIADLSTMLAGKLSLTGGSLTGSLSVTGDITASGNITAYSDLRLKSEVERLTGALDMISRIRGVRFTMNGERNIGVIAQELQAVAPELVREGADEGKTLSVAYGNIAGILIEAVKELRAEVEELRRAA